MIRRTTVATSAFLGVLVAGVLLMPGGGDAVGGADAAGYDETFPLWGIARDFAGHADFRPISEAPFAAVGSVSPRLGANDVPEFIDAARQVASPWIDRSGRVIAPGLPYLYTVPRRPTFTEGTLGDRTHAYIRSKASFRDWFASDIAVNQSTPLSLQTARSGDGVFTFADHSFFPLDGRLLSTDVEETHNNGFTFSGAWQFDYRKGAGQFIEFGGGDGAWLFVDRELVIDLSGIQNHVPQRIDLDQLKTLVVGQRVDVHLFYAQRSEDVARINFRTNVELWTKR